MTLYSVSLYWIKISQFGLKSSRKCTKFVHVYLLYQFKLTAQKFRRKINDMMETIIVLGMVVILENVDKLTFNFNVLFLFFFDKNRSS